MSRDNDDDAPRSRRRDDDGGGRRDVPNNMVLAVLSIFCCWPLAIVAIIKAASVNNLVAAGDYAGAEKASADAKKFALIAIIGGVVVGVIGFIIQIVIGAAAVNAGGGVNAH